MTIKFELYSGLITASNLVRGFVLFLVVVVTGCSDSTPEPSAAAPLPETAPPVDFTVKTDDGQIAISKFRGEVVYLDFWATWCGPCRDSFPWMNEMQEKYKDDGLKVVAVSVDTDHALARNFADELAATFLIGYDDEGTISNLFDVIGMPTSVVIGRDGRVIEKHQGFNLDKVDIYEQSLAKVLDKG